MPPIKYYSQVDTLRAVAALGVINLHWLDSTYLSLYNIQQTFDWGFGKFGVQLFFVLSGFLITDILIANKGNSPVGRIITNFYLRRILRLFPIYYLFVFILVIVKDRFVIGNIVWFLTYTANIKFFMEGGLIDVWSNHLWTLSIEEQFYLLFPFTILFIAKKYEYFIPAIFIVASLVLKNYMGETSTPVYLLTLAQTDMLGVGILISLIKNNNGKLFSKLTTNIMKISSLMVFVICIPLYYYSLQCKMVSYFFPYLLLISFGLLVANTVSGYGGFIGRLFENGILRYFGKISYGLYLYHKIIPLCLLIILKKLNIKIENVLVYYFINISILILISHYSWSFIESKILKLKSRFSYG